MDSETIKTMIRAYNHEVFDKRNKAAYYDMLAPNYIGHDLVSGQDHSLADMIMPDPDPDSITNVHIEIKDIVVEGDRAAFHWSATGLSEGAPVEVVGCSFYRFENGKVVEDTYFNTLVKRA